MHDGSYTPKEQFLKDPDSLCSTVSWRDEEDRVIWVYKIQVSDQITWHRVCVCAIGSLWCLCSSCARASVEAGQEAQLRDMTNSHSAHHSAHHSGSHPLGEA